MEHQEKPTNKPVLVLPSPPSSNDPKPVTALTKEELVDYTENQLVKNARRLVPPMFRSARERLKHTDPSVQAKAFDQIASLYGYTKQAPGAMINILTQNNYGRGGQNPDGMYFEKIVNMMEKKDRPEDDNIIDAEVIEDDE